MNDFNQFGSAKSPLGSDARHCSQCEAMLADALDGTLSPADQASFDLHMSTCATCSEMLADARRGAAWLELLRTPRPEPSDDLLDKILLQTSGVLASGSHRDSAVVTSEMPATLFTTGSHQLRPAAPSSGNVLPFPNRLAVSFRFNSLRHTLLQPRLAMTAAMAFFSVALTLNLTGVQLSKLRASDLRPSSLRRTFYEANAHVARYCDNLRVVYELESRVHDLQNTPQGDSTPEPAPKTEEQKPSPESTPKQTRPKSGSGNSLRQDFHRNRDFALVSLPECYLAPCKDVYATVTSSAILEQELQRKGEQA